MYAHAHAMYSRPPFPQEMRPGIEAKRPVELLFNKEHYVFISIII